jgi:hypothetical protein
VNVSFGVDRSGRVGERVPLTDFFEREPRPLCAATAARMEASPAGRAWLAGFNSFDRNPTCAAASSSGVVARGGRHCVVRLG